MTAADTVGPMAGSPHATVPAEVRPRLASTVLLLRDPPVPPGPPGVEVFVLHRAAGMRFAGGMLAFPGGGVESADYDQGAPAGQHANLARVDWATRLGLIRPGVDLDWARRTADALARAAVRELQEETGVRLHAEQLVPIANWITPAGGRTRYDTFFFVAAQPAGQEAALRTTEASLGEWASPAALLERASAGTVAMLPPTRAMLVELSLAGSVEQALTPRGSLTPITPTILSAPGQPLRVAVDGVELG